MDMTPAVKNQIEELERKIRTDEREIEEYQRTIQSYQQSIFDYGVYIEEARQAVEVKKSLVAFLKGEAK